MVDGTIESVDIMIFILVLGGLIGVVKASGAFESGLAALSTKTKGKEFILVFLVTVLLALGGTLCGIEEEAVALPNFSPSFYCDGGGDSIVLQLGPFSWQVHLEQPFQSLIRFRLLLRQMLLGQLLRKEWQDGFLAW